MKHSQQTTRRTCQPFQPLHALLMPLHTLLQLCQSTRLPDPEELVHLVLQYAQVGQSCPSNSVISVSLLPSLQFTGKSVNTALENREYNGGVDPSYIRT